MHLIFSHIWNRFSLRQWGPEYYRCRLRALALCISFAVILSSCPGSFAGSIQNPYFYQPSWKLWYENPAPVALDDGRVIYPPPRRMRLYPRDPNSEQPGRYLFWTRIAPARNTYAGFWDDVYLSQDQGHSFIRDRWQGRNGNRVQGIRQGMITLTGGDIHQVGANLTSQSTTMMGHDLVNNATRLFQTERRYYFADVLRAGPAHISYIEPQSGPTRDRYQALSPVVYNSIGSSGSETAALTKMVIAGSYLSRELKNQLKQNGLYPSTLLFLWKTALPYKVNFAHELRHRPAYVSLGDQTASKAVSRLQAQELAYFYDDTLHLRNMVEAAKSLTSPPPETVLSVLRNSGGEVVYFLKKSLLIRQKPQESIKLRLSLNNSYDLQDRDLHFQWKVLYGHQNIRIEQDGQTRYYELIVPYEPDLPRGRTVILCMAHNGQSFGNPAVINIYRDWGEINQRPKFSPISDLQVRAGENVRVELRAEDPEGFPVSFAQWAGEVGQIQDNVFIWRCPEDHPPGQESVTIIASDKSSGNCYAARRFLIRVKGKKP